MATSPDSNDSRTQVLTENPSQKWLQRLSRRGRELAQLSAELVLPSTCRLCDGCVPPGGDFCSQCSLRLDSSESAMRSACLRCGRPGAGADRRGPCDHCRSKRLYFDRCIALWTYDGLVRQAVISSKYGSQMPLADALGRRLALRVHAELSTIPLGPSREETAFSDGPDDVAATAAARRGDLEAIPCYPDWVTAVPSHWLRRLHRGGGGCRIIATAVQRGLHRLLTEQYHAASCRYCELLRPTRRIEKQAWLGEKERISNVKGAFRVRNSPATRGRRRGWSDHLQGRTVLLIDDVITTGATSNEIARVLKAAGAQHVVVAVIARALGR